MKIAQTEFAGVAPKLAVTSLAEDLAQEATNVSFDEGLLTGPLVSTAASTDFPLLSSNIRAIAKPTASAARLAFRSASKGVAVANLLTPSDVWGRIYYLVYQPTLGKYRAMYTVKDHYAENQVTVDPVSYALGMSKPWVPPSVGAITIDKSAFVAEPGVDPDVVLDTEFVAYVFTLVDAYGHEGVPSIPSAPVSLPFDAPFSVALSFAPQTVGDTNMNGGVRRLYRAAYDGATSDWQFVADIPWYELSYKDSLPLGQEAESLVSTNWAEPPSMEDLAAVNGSFLASFEDNRISFSEYMLPHAWPEAYRYPLPHDIVAIKSTLGGLFIGTKGTPYWASGTDPSAAVPVSLGTNYPCVSAESVVDMGGFVVYASQDGLVSAEAGGSVLITGDFVDRLRWLRDFSPASIRAFGHEGDYYFSAGTDWWVFTPGGRGLRKTTLRDVTPSNLRQVFYDAERDTTFLLRIDGRVFDVVSQQDGTLDFKWVSKVYRTAPASFSTAQVLSTVYPVTLEVTADGETLSYVVPNERPIRLKAIGQHTRWSLGVKGNALARVMRMAICQSPSELIE